MAGLGTVATIITLWEYFHEVSLFHRAWKVLCALYANTKFWILNPEVHMSFHASVVAKAIDRTFIDVIKQEVIALKRPVCDVHHQANREFAFRFSDSRNFLKIRVMHSAEPANLVRSYAINIDLAEQRLKLFRSVALDEMHHDFYKVCSIIRSHCKGKYREAINLQFKKPISYQKITFTVNSLDVTILKNQLQIANVNGVDYRQAIRTARSLVK